MALGYLLCIETKSDFAHRSEDGVAQPSPSSVEESSSAARQVLELEREALVLRRELQDARAKKEESDQRLVQ